MRRRTSIGSAVTGMPVTNASPDEGARRVARIFIVVVLPAPFGPTSPKISPLPMTRSMPATAIWSS